MSKELNPSLKRLALQIAIQLPDDKREALRTLEYIRELVDWHDDESAGKPVLRIVGPAASA